MHRITCTGMDTRQFQFDDIVIEFGLLPGNGDHLSVAIALHGFSRPFEDMAAVQPLADGRRILALHLAAHGNSSGHHRPLQPAKWCDAIDALMESEGLTFDGILIGYSLGGRIALSWWTHQPERFQKVIVIAPDGLYKNPGYRFSVETALGRAWLEWSRRGRSRERMVATVQWLGRRGLMPRHFHDFALFHIETTEMWSMVVDCWLSLRAFWPPGRRTLKRLTSAHPGVLEAHFGERDRIVKPRNAQTLMDVCPVHFHPCGHGLLRPDIIERIASPS